MSKTQVDLVGPTSRRLRGPLARSSSSRVREMRNRHGGMGAPEARAGRLTMAMDIEVRWMTTAST